MLHKAPKQGEEGPGVWGQSAARDALQERTKRRVRPMQSSRTGKTAWAGQRGCLAARPEWLEPAAADEHGTTHTAIHTCTQTHPRNPGGGASRTWSRCERYCVLVLAWCLSGRHLAHRHPTSTETRGRCPIDTIIDHSCLSRQIDDTLDPGRRRLASCTVELF